VADSFLTVRQGENMKPLIVISIAILLCSCSWSAEEIAFIEKRRAADQVVCSFDNFIWEDTGELGRRFIAYRSNWHVTQCVGRDPEPLRCYYALEGAIRPAVMLCENESGEEEDYRTLTGLI